MNAQPLTLYDVEEQAMILLQENGQVTTLEIKKALRDNGFFATQAQVANGMYIMWQPNDWHWVFNGTYRTYYPSLSEAQEVFEKDEDAYTQTSWLGWLVDPDPVPSAMTDALQDDDEEDDEPYVSGTPEETDDPQPGDWLTFSYSGRVGPVFVTGINKGPRREDARNVARQYFSATFNVEYLDSGANIVK
jgi:hypothetical protein